MSEQPTTRPTTDPVTDGASLPPVTTTAGTAAVVNATAFDYNDRMNSLPVLIFQNVGQAQDRLVTIAWGAALTLVAMILMLTLLARLIQRRSRLS